MMQSPDKAIRRATMVAKGLAKEIGPLPTGDHPKPPHPASMIPGVHVTGMGDEHTAIPDGYGDGGDVGDMPEPQKTVKAYKLFKTKNGKLYPLFVNANKPVPVGQWLAAEEGPQGKSQGRVKSTLGDLAYRPGWHSGDLPVATHIGAKSHADLKAPDTRPSNHVWAEVEHPADVDWQSVANSRARMNAKGEPIPNTAHITDQVPHGGFYRYKTNPNMSGNWLISGGMKVNRVLSDDEVKAINDAHGVADLPRRPGFADGGDVTSNPNFSQWFGNSVAHDNGVPRTYYTGTSKDKDFTSFNVGRHGAWFTTDPHEASQYAESNDSQGHVWENGRFQPTNTASRVIPAYLKAENPYTGERPEAISRAQNYKKAQSDWFDTLRAAGHDSWIPSSLKGNLAVMLRHPTQIKSAIGNSGAFDPKQKAIHKADGGDVEPTDETGFDVWHGTPHDFRAERLIQHPSGEQEHIVGTPEQLPDVPSGATVLKDYPWGRFRSQAIGSGEGNQAYSHGLYTAQRQSVAKWYKDMLRGVNEISLANESHKRNLPLSEGARAEMWRQSISDSNPSEASRNLQKINAEASQQPHAALANLINDYRNSNRGHLLHVRVNANPDHFLDWDKTLAEQHPHVQAALAADDESEGPIWREQFELKHHGHLTGKEIHGIIRDENTHQVRRMAAKGKPFIDFDAETARQLHEAGIPGVKYLDERSRSGTSNPMRNYVIFDPSIMDIKRKYARGGVVGHYGIGGYTSPDDSVVQEALKRVASPFSENPEHVQEALRIASTFQVPTGNKQSKQTGGYYNIKQPMGVSDVNPTIAPLGNVSMVPKKNISWEDLYNQGKGGSFINMGGDRSNLGKLTHINDKPLAWPVDLHAGPKYMREPNPGTIWANNITHASGFKNAVRRAAENGPVYGIYAPMGPQSVDSSHNMFDAVMAQIPGSNISKEDADKFDKDVKNASFLPASEKEKKEYVQELMSGWPGVLNAKEASEFARTLIGTHRSGIIKHMDKKTWREAGFPSIGMTRAAITDPEVLYAPGNMLGHRVVKFDPNNLEGIEEAFSHSTYTHPTAGQYVGDIPLVQRHYAAPDVIEQLLRKRTKKDEVIHPYSIDPGGRSAARKAFEEHKQIQPINQRMLDSVLLGLQRQKDYGFSSGDDIDHALKLARQQTPVPVAAKKKSGT